MLEALAQYLPESTYKKPKRGFFIWVALPSPIDTSPFFIALFMKKKFRFRLDLLFPLGIKSNLKIACV
ncbi:MAG: hypothetical protein K2X02_06455 [Alphaproteobacteria bacterium]|nr:hypothetical protein [Alphaproteobacteria bacterium]